MDNVKQRDINHEQEIYELFSKGLSSSKLHENIMEYHPFDVARVFEQLDSEQRNALYVALSPQEIAPIFEHLDHDDIPNLFLELSDSYSVKVLEHMDLDETVSILRGIRDEDTRFSYIALMDRDFAKQVLQLLTYDEESVGSIMGSSYIVLNTSMLISDAMRKMLKEAKTVSYINTLYVVNQKKELVGVLSLRELIVAGKDDKLIDVMGEKIISVDVDSAKERAATLFKDYDFQALPVVDKQKRMVGILTVDDIIDFLDYEAREDYAKFAGIIDGSIERRDGSIKKSIIKRIPWLVILLFIGIVAALLTGMFEDTLAAIPILAMFLPMMLDMAGNVGTQSLAVTIRYLMEDDFVNRKNISKHILKEFGIGLANGLIVAVTAFLIALSVLGIKEGNVGALTLITSAIISLSMFVSIIVSNVAGAIVPLIINALKIDPAAASGPFITTINDIIAITIYFSLATALLIPLL